jgi:hypothetical protein
MIAEKEEGSLPIRPLLHFQNKSTDAQHHSWIVALSNYQEDRKFCYVFRTGLSLGQMARICRIPPGGTGVAFSLNAYNPTA